jgi:RNA polymerase sigma-70 factor, ECF subfamily
MAVRCSFLEIQDTVLDDQLLLNRVRALEPEALTQVHNTYYVPIFRYVFLQVGDMATAEDLTSEVFIRLLKALRDHTTPRNTLQGWLFSVANIVVKEHFRKQYRARQISLDDSLPSAGAGPDQIMETELVNQKLQAAVTELTEEQRQVIALRFGYEMPIESVAQTLGKSVGAVKMLQARAIASLTRILKREAIYS